MTRENLAPRIDAPAPALAEVFARHIRAWSQRSGADDASADAAAGAARAVSLALFDGHVCIDVAELGNLAAGAPQGGDAPGDASGDAAAWRRMLRASGVVGSADDPGSMPLVLDADGRLYLHRYFDYERRLAARVRRAADAATAVHLHAVERQEQESPCGGGTCHRNKRIEIHHPASDHDLRQSA